MAERDGTEDGNIGRQVGNYRLIAVINSGTFGTVYQAKHIIFEDEPIVAIKLLRTPLRSPKERDDFYREANVLKKLHHPFILHVLDAGFHANIPYIVTDYASRGSLRDGIVRKAGQPLPIDDAIKILSQIGQALSLAHQYNIVHRDLKPENILFNAKGDALLADFGIAILLEKTSKVDVIGSPNYMAPEQFEGIVSTKSDQYSLGCIAYELLTGRKPFIAPDPISVGWKHTKEAPVPPRQLNPLIPAHVEQAILKAMSKDRANRYADVAAFINVLSVSNAPHVVAAPTIIPPAKTKEQWLEEGYALLNLKRYEEALVAYEQAIRLDPNYASAYHKKGEALYTLKRYEEALVAYEQALRLNPNYAYAYNNKGNALYNLKRYEEALAAYEQALRLDPNYALAYHNEGLTLKQLGREHVAEQAFDKARQLGIRV
jgi:serine/threonine protein kinase